MAARLRVLEEADPIGKLIDAAETGTISLGDQRVTLSADQYLAVLRDLRRLAVPDAKSAPVRLDGMSEVTTAADVLKAISLVVGRMATGEITPDEALAVTGMLELQRRAIETAELEPRLTRLEELQEEQRRRARRR